MPTRLLVKAGSGVATLGVPDSPGVPADFARHTLIADFNDLDSVQALCGRKPRNELPASSSNP